MIPMSHWLDHRDWRFFENKQHNSVGGLCMQPPNFAAGFAFTNFRF